MRHDRGLGGVKEECLGVVAPLFFGHLGDENTCFVDILSFQMSSFASKPLYLFPLLALNLRECRAYRIPISFVAEWHCFP